MLPLPDDATLRRLLAAPKTIAIVGLSPKAARPSHAVARYLLAAGQRVIPVNPGQQQILGLACFPSLSVLETPVDIAVIFRRPEEVLPLVEEALAMGIPLIWMQEGITHRDAARMALAAGSTVVMDRCIKTEHHRLFCPSTETPFTMHR